MKTSYDPAATFDLEVSEVEFRRTERGRQLMARAYQPQRAGPFPTVLDVRPDRIRLRQEPRSARR